MKRSKLLLTASVIFSLLTLYIKYSCARSYKEIHHLLTDDEREEIFGHPLVENVPEYDVFHPVQVDAAGRFLSRDLANGNARRKRDIGSAGIKEPVFFKLSAFGQDLHLNVTINDELFSPHFEVEIRGNGSSEFHYEIDHCHYLGQLLSVKGKGNKVAVSNCDGLKGLIRTPQDVFMVHPLPDRLKLGKNNTRAHVIHRRSLSPMHAQTLKEALEEEKRSDSWCGVEGRSTVQQSDESESDMNFPRSSGNSQKTIESMIVVEKVMTKFYGVPAIKKYVPTIVNMAHGLLADDSIGANIKYIIHKLLILEQDMRGLVINTHAAGTLTSFCQWTTGQNVDDDRSKRHFDHAALISKINFCRSKQPNAQDCGSILGLADLEGMCRQDTSCTLNKDTGLGTAFTLAHETAHNLGAEHDEEGNKCNDGVYIMATRASGKETAFDWSPCSRNYVKNFLKTRQSQCLNDDAKNRVEIPPGKPGRLYDGNDQCVRMFGAGSKVCEIPDLKQKMCVNLYCEKPDGYCSSNDEPAADGTICGDNKECMRGRCVPVTDKPNKRPNKPNKRPNKPNKGNKRPITSGVLKKFTYDQTPGSWDDYYVVIATLPVGARKIKIEEATASENNLLLEDADYNNILDYDTYQPDVRQRTFKGAGTTFLFKKKKQKEIITSPGPLKESLTLLYEKVNEWDPYKVNYQYIKPGSQSTRSLSFDSDLPELFREIYEVDEELREADEKSEDVESPETKRMARWEVGVWTYCTKSCNDGEHGVRTREVFCVHDSQGVELELKDSECKEPKPVTQEACGTQPCPAEWNTVHVGQCSTSCGPGVQTLTIECVRINSSGETQTVDAKECQNEMMPPTRVACNVENPCEDELEAED